MFEYKVVPAPEKPAKVRGLKTGAARFAHGVQDVLNTLAAEGWDYLRTDRLPCSERHGLFRSLKTVERDFLVFRRPRPEAEAATPTPAQTRIAQLRARLPETAPPARRLSTDPHPAAAPTEAAPLSATRSPAAPIRSEPTE